MPFEIYILDFVLDATHKLRGQEAKVCHKVASHFSTKAQCGIFLCNSISDHKAPRLVRPRTKSGHETLPALNFWTLLAARHFRPWTSPASNLETSPALRHFHP